MRTRQSFSERTQEQQLQAAQGEQPPTVISPVRLNPHLYQPQKHCHWKDGELPQPMQCLSQTENPIEKQSFSFTLMF